MAGIVGFTVLLFGSIAFVAIIFPIWMIVHGLRSKTLSKNAKVIWVCVMILAFWPTGAYVYGLFGSRARWAQWCAGFIVSLVILLFGYWLAALPAVEERAQVQLEASLETADQVQFVGIDETERQQLRVRLEALRPDLSGGILRWDRMEISKDLIDLFQHYASDGKFSDDEYTDWKNLHTSRGRLNASDFGRYVLGKRAYRN